MSLKTLTKDAISSLCNLNHAGTDGFYPVVQLIDFEKKVPENNPSKVIWRLVLSDGYYFCEAALATSLYSVIDGGLLTKLSFIKLLKHNATTIGKPIVVVVQDLEVVVNSEYI